MRVGYMMAAMIFMVIACRSREEKDIIGLWKCVSVVQEGEPLPIDPGLLQLEFTKEMQYSYQGTLKQTEQGTYEVEEDYLVVHPQTGPAQGEVRKLLITYLSKDTLTLDMNQEGQLQSMELVKVAK